MDTLSFSDRGIGELIGAGGLHVPTHQREYSWELEHALDLFADIHSAINKGEKSYFLGTVVLTRRKQDVLEVVDGQQRLATATIMLSVIRDIFHARNEAMMVRYVEESFLFRIDPDTEDVVPKLTLNLKDREFFQSSVLSNPERRGRSNGKRTTKQSNERIAAASREIRSKFEGILAAIPKATHKDALKEWLDFVKCGAQIIVLTMPSDRNAYRMFETLNDRGLKVSQADLVKNYVYGGCGDKLSQVQAKWASMITMMESLGLGEDVIDYLRILCSLFYGMTRKHEVFDVIRDNVTSETRVVQFAHQLEDYAYDYVAMLSPDHPKWNEYPPAIRRSIRTLELLDVVQIRYLMLAVARYFSKTEATRAFNLFVNWTVRFFVAGTDRVGRVDTEYANLANDIHSGKAVKSAECLAKRMSPVIAGDDEFRLAFSTTRVSQAKLARYYLDALERRNVGDDENAGLVPDDDISKVNLEHIIPLNYESNWRGLDHETASNLYNRLGNLVLLNAKKNSKIGNYGFKEKKRAFADSPFTLTQLVAKFSKWGTDQVTERQIQLAEIAVKTWPLMVK
jgi:hypothetical protein